MEEQTKYTMVLTDREPEEVWCWDLNWDWCTDDTRLCCDLSAFTFDDYIVFWLWADDVRRLGGDWRSRPVIGILSPYYIVKCFTILSSAESRQSESLFLALVYMASRGSMQLHRDVLGDGAGILGDEHHDCMRSSLRMQECSTNSLLATTIERQMQMYSITWSHTFSKHLTYLNAISVDLQDGLVLKSRPYRLCTRLLILAHDWFEILMIGGTLLLSQTDWFKRSSSLADNSIFDLCLNILCYLWPASAANYKGLFTFGVGWRAGPNSSNFNQ